VDADDRPAAACRQIQARRSDAVMSEVWLCFANPLRYHSPTAKARLCRRFRAYPAQRVDLEGQLRRHQRTVPLSRHAAPAIRQGSTPAPEPFTTYSTSAAAAPISRRQPPHLRSRSLCLIVFAAGTAGIALLGLRMH
jgi:hypothetical protein